MIDIATIDEYLSRQGRFCLIDWLLTDNFLRYADYEAWRYGELKNLEDLLQFDRQPSPFPSVTQIQMGPSLASPPFA